MHRVRRCTTIGDVGPELWVRHRPEATLHDVLDAPVGRSAIDHGAGSAGFRPSRPPALCRWMGLRSPRRCSACCARDSAWELDRVTLVQPPIYDGSGSLVTTGPSDQGSTRLRGRFSRSKRRPPARRTLVVVAAVRDVAQTAEAVVATVGVDAPRLDLRAVRAGLDVEAVGRVGLKRRTEVTGRQPSAWSPVRSCPSACYAGTELAGAWSRITSSAPRARSRAGAWRHRALPCQGRATPRNWCAGRAEPGRVPRRL
jgi:hypothetical protein